ncbi:MAG: hypothetical protein K2O73_05565 [Lachnospiraceae bacterium]|nr:hypothetical protein [Lachnospiraceae bacterium]
MKLFNKYKKCMLLVCILFIGAVIGITGCYGSNNEENAYFFPQEQTSVEYESYIYPLSSREIWQPLNLNIKKLKEFENGILYALELDQLEETDDPWDQISMGRQYLGYFYVTEIAVYRKAVETSDGFTQEQTDKMIELIEKDEEAFCADCTIVCCENGTEDIVDEDGYHAYVEASGEQITYHMYNDYAYGTKPYEKIVWEKGKGIVYYVYGAGNMLMNVMLWTEEYRDRIYSQIEEYIRQEVPEIAEYEKKLLEESKGEVSLVLNVSMKGSEDFTSKPGWYFIYVKERRGEEEQDVVCFAVNESKNNVYWYYPIENGEFFSLEEWRRSSYYSEIGW